MARIYDRFGVRLALRNVFEARTIHQLAELIYAVAPDATVASAPAEDDREEMEF